MDKPPKSIIELSQSCKYILRILGKEDDWSLVAEIKGEDCRCSMGAYYE